MDSVAEVPIITFFGEKFLFLQNKKTIKTMCTVTINIDEATMRKINPSLTTRESIGKWLQHRVDLMIEEIVAKEAETMDLETARTLLHQMVKEVYSRP